jgi:uncharacterized protein (DUF1015 family)
MASVKPFRALRPKTELAGDICELPYDVLSSSEARVAIKGRPQSFFHVSKPEVDLAEGIDPHDEAVYAKGRENFDRLIGEGFLKQEEKPCYFLYRQVMGQHAQIGLVAVASCQEYDDGIVKKHEFTRPDKENDRVKHMEALDAQTGPVFLTYPANASLDGLFAEITSGEPEIDFVGKDDVRHSSWTISSQETIQTIEEQFRAIPTLYIADGHHRSAAASRVAEARGGANHSGDFLTVLFPHNQMQILAYNRFVKDLNGLTAETFMERVGAVASIEEVATSFEPKEKHSVGMFLGGKWYRLGFNQDVRSAEDPVERLDVSLLQQHVLNPLLGIDDPRTSYRVSFVGGIRGNGELERLVNESDGGVAFSMYPTDIEDLMAIADADQIMPPKSTWFEPKLRDAMFSHMLR